MKQVLLLFSVLVLSWNVSLPLSAKAKLETGPVISGSVVDTDGNPVAGAVVTDGFTHSETDVNGNFRFESPFPFRVRFVSVRIPSDYLPVLQKGVPTFFSPLPQYKGKERRTNITLVKRKSNEDTYSMMMIADPQAHFYTPENKSENIGYAGTDVWKDMFTDMRQTISASEFPFYGMCLGDIAALNVGAKSAYPSVYLEYCKGMETLGIPFFNVVGNHDHILNNEVETDDESVLTYEDFFGPRNYSFDIGKVHHVVMDNTIYKKGYRRYPVIYGLEDAYLEWLKGDLERVPKDMPVMIYMHANLFNEKGPLNLKYDGLPGTYGIEELLAALQGFDKLYIWAGHTHAGEFIGRIESPKNPSGIETFIVGRGTGGYANEHICPEGTPRGYVIMDVNGKDISWRYQVQNIDTAPFRGRKKPELKLKTRENNQLHAYSRGSYGDDCVYANVYLWDKHWQMPILRIGDQVYTMTRDDVYDLSYKEVILAYQPWTKKKLNYSGRRTHSFMVRVPQEVSGEGTVEVIDRWGRKWSQTVSLDPIRYADNCENLYFQFDVLPESCRDTLAKQINISREYKGKEYQFTLSGGYWVAADEDVAAHICLAGKGAKLTLPAVVGHKLTKVLVQPFGNRNKGQAAYVSDSNGETILGGDRLPFFGNATDGWILSNTAENTSYSIVSDSKCFLIGEIRLTYEPVR